MALIESTPPHLDGARPANLIHECSERGETASGEVWYSCGGEFLCPGCERVRGYCRGAYDDLLELCDDCAVKVWDVRAVAEPYNADLDLSDEDLVRIERARERVLAFARAFES